MALALTFVGCSSGPDPEPAPTVEQQAINGGTSTSNTTWPWSVKIIQGRNLSGGALIAPGWVLTVAHSLTKDIAQNYHVQLGSGVTVDGAELVIHPSYVDDQAVTGHFDVGLIKLSQLALPTSGVGYIRPAVGDDGPGLTATAIGWGMTNHDFNHPVVPSQLQQVSIPVVSSSSCNNVLPVRRVIFPDELCAGFSDGAKGVCFGDSGSPLMVQRSSGTWEQIGAPAGVNIQSNGAACNTYAVFNRTSALVNWIRGYVPDVAWFSALDTVLL